MKNELFTNNLVMVDSKLPEILNAIQIISKQKNVLDIKNLTTELMKDNPLRYPKESLSIIYKYKIKRLLFDLAYGLKENEVWYGKYNESIEYTLIKNGEKYICTHNCTINIFSDYLYETSTLDVDGRICLNL